MMLFQHDDENGWPRKMGENMQAHFQEYMKQPYGRLKLYRTILMSNAKIVISQNETRLVILLSTAMIMSAIYFDLSGFMKIVVILSACLTVATPLIAIVGPIMYLYMQQGKAMRQQLYESENLNQR